MELIVVGVLGLLLLGFFWFFGRRKTSNLEVVDNEEEEYDRFFGAPW